MKVKANENPHKKKSKSGQKKPKSDKFKQQSFNPVQYLNVHLDIVDPRSHLGHRKSIVNRNLKSGLSRSYQTQDQTPSKCKFRSRTSQDDYRQTNVPPLKGVFSLKFDSLITEEDNVQFTEVTPRGEEEPYPIPSLKLRKRELSIQVAAIRIQRAWKKYQTLKMVKHYYQTYQYEYLKKITHNKEGKVHLDLQKTLKIKRRTPSKKQQGNDTQNYQPNSQSKTIPFQAVRIQVNNDSESGDSMRHKTPIELIPSSSESSLQSHGGLFSVVLNRTQQRRRLLDQNHNEKESQKNTYQNLKLEQNQFRPEQNYAVQKLIANFSRAHQAAEQQMDRKIQSLFKESIEGSRVSASSDDDRQSASEEPYTNVYSPKINLNDYDSNSEISQKESNDCFCPYSTPEYKIFQLRVQVLKQKKGEDLEKVQNLQKIGAITADQAFKKKERIIGMYQIEKRKTWKGRQKYDICVEQMNKNALSYHIDQRSISKFKDSKQLFRSSFSAETIILKSILKEASHNQLQLQTQASPFKELEISEVSMNRSEQNLDFDDESIISDAQLIKFPENKQPHLDSERIQEELFENIFNEAVQEFFLNEKIMQFFRPYLDEIYEFRRITDEDIKQFLVEMVPFYSPEEEIVRRVNQKINPTSLQILKIIRNCEYQAEQYELILSESTFRGMRKKIEEKFERRKVEKLAGVKEPDSRVSNLQLIEKIKSVRQDKSLKIEKYCSFERDLFIMYMKAVFNALNEIMIEAKSFNTFMNSRSSIGPGELTLALKEYNKSCSKSECFELLRNSNQKVQSIVRNKCSIPSFKSYHELQLFQKQISKQIKIELDEGEFKWVNTMDEVLEIWQQVVFGIEDRLIEQFLLEFHYS